MLNYDELFASISRSRRSLEPFRSNRMEAVKMYAGDRWSFETREEPVVVNLLSQYVTIVGRTLISQNPRVNISAFEREHKAPVDQMQSWVNKEIKRLELAETFERAVIDSLFCIGILKVALATPADSASNSWEVPAGAPFCEVVDLDDFAFDIGAKRFSEASWMGHRIRVPLEAVQSDEMYGPSRRKLTATPLSRHNEQGDDKTSALGRMDSSYENDFEPMVDLWEIYLPRHRKVLTFASQQIDGEIDTQEPLREQDWIGPYCGPYHFLGLGVVPGNAMPKAPIQDLVYMHEKLNVIWRKLIRQAERQKENGVCSNTEDAARLRDADDGQIIFANADSTKFIFSGGPNQQNSAFSITLADQFNRAAGNLDLLAGAGPQSKTATQDKLLNENAGRAIQDMQNRTERFVHGVLNALCWYWWNDPFKTMRTKFSIPGMPGIEIPRKLGPDKRQQIPFEELEIRLDPYSLRNKTPEQRMQQLTDIVTNVYIPMAEQAAAQGITLDWNAFFEKAARFYDEPDLVDLLTIREPPKTDSSVGGSHDRKMPLKTERSYERVNRSEVTREASNQNMVSALMGIDTGGERTGEVQ